MSRLLGNTAKTITPYTPGQQPKDKKYIKLNTNENPYPPAPAVQEVLRSLRAENLPLYPDPTAAPLRQAMADTYGITPEQVFAGGGSDEVLAFAFMAFFDPGDTVYFADITYGFYQVYADLFGLRAKTIPLNEDFTTDITRYFNLDGNIFIANPNAPTGLCLYPSQIEEVLQHNPDRLVVIDEAYIDFSGGQTCLPLIQSYDNLLVVQTFSKSRGLAGMRLGFGFGDPTLMDGLERIKYSFNPYNIDRISAEVGVASLSQPEYLAEQIAAILAARSATTKALEALGFRVLPSEANFIFATHPALSAQALARYLSEHGVLIRYFSLPRISEYIRITIGTPTHMASLVEAITHFIEGK